MDTNWEGAAKAVAPLLLDPGPVTHGLSNSCIGSWLHVLPHHCCIYKLCLCSPHKNRVTLNAQLPTAQLQQGAPHRGAQRQAQGPASPRLTPRHSKENPGAGSAAGNSCSSLSHSTNTTSASPTHPSLLKDLTEARSHTGTTEEVAGGQGTREATQKCVEQGSGGLQTADKQPPLPRVLPPGQAEHVAPSTSAPEGPGWWESSECLPSKILSVLQRSSMSYLLHALSLVL